MDIGCVKESAPGERRVALTPDATKKMVAAGHRVTVEHGAGIEAGFFDSSYETAGAYIGDVQASLGSEVVLAINSPRPCPSTAINPHRLAATSRRTGNDGCSFEKRCERDRI